MIMSKRGVAGLTIGIIVLAVAVVAIFLFAFRPGGVVPEDKQRSIVVSDQIPVDSGQVGAAGTGEISWLDIELTDVTTGETFTIRQFSDKPVLLESFAVWCPICTAQQRRVLDLHEELGDSFVSISIDTDPNEDAAFVADYIEREGFTWRYAVSPPDLTLQLIDLFGIDIINAPSAPMILICDGSKARQLDRGIKSVEVLKEELSRGC